jgi:hypothetical protein
MLPMAAVASLLVLYFDWRGRLIRGVRTEHNGHRGSGKEVPCRSDRSERSLSDSTARASSDRPQRQFRLPREV